MKRTEYTTQFVETAPSTLEDGILYVLPHFEVAIHNCMCGCGEKVVTPLSDGHWAWNYDGENATLSPSVGNFQYNCKSHYFLRQGKVVWV